MATIGNDPVWLISGCSTGFGLELAKLVLERGEKVVATARTPETISYLERDHPERCLVLALDVTDSQQVALAVRAAEQRFGHVDVLVNNAGYGYMSPLEEGDEAEYRALFETNVFGLIALTRAVIPGMRERQRGHIVNISSVSGINGNAGTGFYSGTKFAVEGISESLAAELRAFNISVTVVEPGAFRTDFTVRSLRTRPSAVPGYEQSAGMVMNRLIESAPRHKGDPKRAVAIIYDAVHAPRPPFRLPMGSDAVKLAKAKIAAWGAELSEWEAVASGADFPEA